MTEKLYLIILYFTIYLNTYAVKSEEISTNELTLMKNVLSYDVFEIQMGLQHLKTSVEILDKRHSQQLDDLKGVVSTCHEYFTAPESLQYNEDVCDETLVNETLTKYVQFNNELVTKLTESHKNQTESLDAILKIENLNKGCPALETDATATSTDIILSRIDDKLNKFEQQLSQFETLEAKLSMQQTKFENLNENHLKMLMEIKEKLLQNEQKFVKYQKELPDMNNFSNKISNLANWKHWRHRHAPRQ